MTKRILAVISAGVVAMGFTGCGKSAENSNQSVHLPQSTTSSKPASVAQSSVSTPSESGGTSDVQVIPQQEKRQLTAEELAECRATVNELFDNPYMPIFSDGKFNYSDCIYEPGVFEYLLRTFPKRDIPADSEASPYIEGRIYTYSPESVQRIIREKFAPDFELSNIDYQKLYYWDEDKKAFDIFVYDNAYFSPCIVESGYKVGGEYWLNVVPCRNFMLVTKLYELSETYFEIPRKEIRLKDGVIVYCRENDDRPEWVEVAEKFYKDNNLGNEYMVGRAASYEYQSIQPKREAGVISTPLGKRMYLYEQSSVQGSTQFSYSHIISTWGLRGHNDNIKYSISSYGMGNSGGTPNKYFDRKHTEISFNDVLSDKEYIYYLKDDRIDTFEENGEISQEYDYEESWKLNGMDIPEKKFNSEEFVSYFLENFKGDGRYDPYTFDTLYSCEVTESLTLNDYYNICRIIME